MKMLKTGFVMLIALFFAAQFAYAGPKTLITMEDGKAVAGLAKSWSKLEDGKYEFVLDTSLTLKKGKPLTTDAVKNSVEAKMKKTFSVSVEAPAKDKVHISYKGDEQKFLEKIAKTRIRAKKAIELAVESAVSEGGIRANKTNRGPNPGEVKARILKVSKSTITILVTTSKTSQIEDGARIKVKRTNKDLIFKKGANIFFVPEKQEKDVWIPMKNTLKDM